MKERFENVSKTRKGLAGVVTLLLLGISILTVWGEGLQTGKLILALFFSVFVGLTIIVDIEIHDVVTGILMFLFPLGVLALVECYTHVPWDLTVMITLLNYLFYFLLYLMMMAFFGSRVGFVLAALLPMAFGLVNYAVVSFRSAPLVPWDAYSISIAMTVSDSYEFIVSYRLVFVIIGFVWIMSLGEKTRVRIWHVPARIGIALLSVLLLGGYVKAIRLEKVQNAFEMDNTLFTPNVMYRNNGLIAAFLANFRYLTVEKPEGYSVEAANEIIQQAGISTQTDEEKKDGPNIIVVMNEALSDLSVYGDFGISEDPLPFIRSLEQNTVKGSMSVSVRGGNTANTEFEFLTGNSMAFMPDGSVAYQQFIKEQMPSLASQLVHNGYTAAAMHPYYAKGWNRNTVYPSLGFQETYFIDDYSNAATLRGYVDDKSVFEKIIERYEKKESDEKLFSFAVTMQNHGGYSKEYEDLQAEIFLTDIAEEDKGTQIRATENYLTLMKITDTEFKHFIEYFEGQEEDTIILMFGDHQPSTYVTNPILRVLGIDVETWEESIDNFAIGYQVPFVMWANYDIEEQAVEGISANYLGGLLLENAGLPLTGYQTYLKNLRKDYPIITANFYQDSTGVLKEYSGDELQDYAILQYNNMVDNERRVADFFF